MKQKELAFRCSNVHIYQFFDKISLGSNSYVNRSAVPALKSEDEHGSFANKSVVLVHIHLIC